MCLIRSLHNLKPQHRRAVVTFGNFDGVHLGHQALLRALNDMAEIIKAKRMVILFEPQPLEFFKGEEAPARLYLWHEKLKVLRNFVDHVLLVRFDKVFSQMSAVDFIETFLLKELEIKGMVIGDDFRFGHKRLGDVSMLREASERNQFALHIHEQITIAGGRVSSTAVREALAVADFKLARRLLGRDYVLSGSVIRGAARGRTIDVPTANINLKRCKIPFKGVYAARVNMPHVKNWPAVVNMGTRPTFNGNNTLLEVHLLDFEGDLYGERLEVTFVERIRDERKFDGIDALKRQIDLDKKQALQLLISDRISETL